MKRRGARVLACVIAAALVLGPTPRALAQNDAAVATELFNAGRDLMKRGDFAAACPKLAESARLDAKVGTLAKLGECEEKLGHLVTARASWQKAHNVAETQHDARLSHVDEELARLDRIVPKLVFEMGANPPKNVSLTLDDLQVGTATLGVPVPVEPGRHVVTATAPHKRAWSTTIETKADGMTTTVTVPPLEDAPEPEPATAPVTPPSSAPPSTTAPTPAGTVAPPSVDRGRDGALRPIGIVTAGAGVVAIGVGVYLGLHAKSQFDQSNNTGCAGNDCTAAAAATRNDARSSGNLATIAFIAGGVLIAAGATMWIVARTPSSNVALRLTPTFVDGTF